MQENKQKKTYIAPPTGQETVVPTEETWYQKGNSHPSCYEPQNQPGKKTNLLILWEDDHSAFKPSV